MDIDNKALISLVFDKRPLWDRRNKFYSNRNVIEKCWKDISLEMKQDENKIRKKWRYLRDQFAVELGKIPSGSGDKETICPKWPYFKDLLFLKSVVKARPTSRSLNRRSLGKVKIKTEDPSTKDFPIKYSPINTDDEDASDQSTTNQKPLNDQIWIIDNQKPKCSQEKSRKNQTDVDDEHLLFFRSLLPHIENIPKHRILSFRSRIQSVVDEFAYQSMQHDDRSTNCSQFTNNSRVSTPETYDEMD